MGATLIHYSLKTPSMTDIIYTMKASLWFYEGILFAEKANFNV